jgi:hypothetical protein
MIKRIILFVVQFACFFGLMDVGGNWDFINLSLEMRQLQQGIMQPKVLIPTIKYPISSTHILIANGLIYAGILLALILLIEALRKKLKPWGGITVLAWVCAVVLALALKMGLPPAPTTDGLLMHFQWIARPFLG